MAAMDVRSIGEALAGMHPPPGADHLRKALWSPRETASQLNVELYAMPPGGKVDTRYHPHHMAMVICWQGSGEVTIAPVDASEDEPSWGEAYATFKVRELDSFLVPRGALHRFVADPRQNDPRLGWVLLVVNPLGDFELSEHPGTLPDIGSVPFRWTKKLKPGASYDPETQKPIYSFDRIEGHRAKRIRVWGREAVDPNGDPDPAKEQFHVVAYPFNERQENPAHFHPYSVELMIAIDGTTDVFTRAKRWHSNGKPRPGWSNLHRPGVLKQGDTAVVALGDIHRYVNNTDADSIVLAMQTPHPIMHTLEHETNF